MLCNQKYLGLRSYFICLDNDNGFLTCCFELILEAAPNKIDAVQQLVSHLKK